MTLTYGRYLELLSALDEYTNCTLDKADLQRLIYDHFINKYGSFICGNAKSELKLFVKPSVVSKPKKEKKAFKEFITFINQSLQLKHKK